MKKAFLKKKECLFYISVIVTNYKLVGILFETTEIAKFYEPACSICESFYVHLPSVRENEISACP